MLKKLLNFIFGDFLPCCILSREPLILISYWQDFFQARNRILPCLGTTSSVYFLFQLGWHRETQERAKELRDEAEKVRREHANLNFIFLCNSPLEEKLLRECGLEAVYCHQNAFLDETRYKIISGVKKVYDAIYIARITPFKRHYLAAQIKNLKLIGDYFAIEKEHYAEVMQLMPHADWSKKVFSWHIYKAINQAKVGLCLSREEGAMFVSAEYLLCGLPVVNTPNLGGRDEMFDPEYAITVQDTPEAVAAGVREMISRNIAPETVREKTLQKMAVHRETLKKLISQIYRQEKCIKNIQIEWPRIFIHKLGLRCTVPPHVKMRRIMRAVEKTGN